MINLYLSLGIILLAYFPSIGNALSFIIPFPRRMIQITLISMAFLLIARWILRNFNSKTEVQSIRKTILGSWKPTLLLFAICVGMTVPNIFDGNFRFSAFQEIVVFFLMLFVLFFYVGSPQRLPSPKAERDRRKHILGIVLLGIVWTMALVAWTQGPKELEVLSDLGGSTILLGSAGCALGFIGLSLYSAPLSWLIAAPAFYVMMMSTARTGILLFLIFTGLFALKQLYLFVLDRYWLRILNMVSAPAIVFGIMWAITMQSPYFPYYSPDASLQLIEYRQLEMTRRLSRMVRIFGQDDPEMAEQAQVLYKLILPASLCDKDGVCTNKEEMDRLSMHPEVRWQMLDETWKAIVARPFGHWPERYDTFVKIPCYKENQKEIFCPYSHNILLEIGFYFGIPALLLTFTLFMLAFGKGIWMWVRSRNQQTDILFTVIAGLALNMQLTGMMIEHSAWIILVFVAAMYSERTYDSPVA